MYDRIQTVLDEYRKKHPDSEATCFVKSSGTMSIRVIDSFFENLAKTKRHTYLWEFLEARLSEEVMSNISLLVTFTPEEVTNSMANAEFEKWCNDGK